MRRLQNAAGCELPQLPQLAHSSSRGSASDWLDLPGDRPMAGLGQLPAMTHQQSAGLRIRDGWPEAAA